LGTAPERMDGKGDVTPEGLLKKLKPQCCKELLIGGVETRYNQQETVGIPTEQKYTGVGAGGKASDLRHINHRSPNQDDVGLGWANSKRGRPSMV